jgi:hypothetical protein
VALVDRHTFTGLLIIARRAALACASVVWLSTVMPGSYVQETITCTGLSLPVRFGVDDGRIIFCIAWDYKTNQNQDKRIDEHSKEAYCKNVQETITSIRFCLDDGRPLLS